MVSDADLGKLMTSLSNWEQAGHAVTLAVAFRVAGEVIHDFTDWFKTSWLWREKGNKASALLLVAALFAEVIVQNNTNSISGKINIELQLAAASLHEGANLTDEFLLAERRSTANDRWRLDRVERIVYPRSISQEQWSALVSALRGKAKTFSIWFVDKTEPMNFAAQLWQLFREAGIQTNFTALPRNSNQLGVATWVTSDEGEEVASILWKTAKIGGGTFGVRPIGLEFLPANENCLIVGENDAALQPADGQAGEGIDAHGVPLPPRQ